MRPSDRGRWRTYATGALTGLLALPEPATEDGGPEVVIDEPQELAQTAAMYADLMLAEERNRFEPKAEDEEE